MAEWAVFLVPALAPPQALKEPAGPRDLFTKLRAALVGRMGEWLITLENRVFPVTPAAPIIKPGSDRKTLEVLYGVMQSSTTGG